MVPFHGTFGSGGLRMWEFLTEPYYAKGEDSTALRDINLFSLCNIKIFADRPEQNPAHLKIDFSRMDIPSSIKITKEEVISSLLDCIIYAQVNPPREKPTVTLTGKPEDEDLLKRATEQYKKATYSNPVINLNINID